MPRETIVPLSSVSGVGLVPILQSFGENLVGCELGVCSAINLRYFLDSLDNLHKIYAIDPWQPYDDWNRPIYQEEVDRWKAEAMAYIDPYKDKVTILEMDSLSAAAHIPDGSLDFIFIDGDHSYDAVLRDVNLYWSKVRPGGIFAGHDWNLPDVNRAVQEYRNTNNITTPVHNVDNNVWFWIK